MGVIYLRTNLVNGLQYVGQTKNFYSRECAWRTLGNKYANNQLTKDRNEYGLENWKCEILEDNVPDEERYELEQFYIDKYGTRYPSGYNMGEGGKTPHGWKLSKKQKDNISKLAKNRKGNKNNFFGKHHSEESKKRMRIKHKHREVCQLSLNFELIKTWVSTHEPSIENFKQSKVYDACCGKNCKAGHKYKGFYWYFKDEYDELIKNATN